MRGRLGARLLLGIASTGVMIGLLAALLARIEPQEALRALTAVQLRGLPLLGVALAANHALRIFRLGALLGPETPVRGLVLTSLVGFVAITLLPLRLGELARPALLAREGVPLYRTVAALVVERLLDLILLLLLLGWVGLAMPLGTSWVVDGVDLVVVGQRTVATVALIALIALIGVGLLGTSVRRLPGIGPPLAQLAHAIRELIRAPLRGLGAIGFTVALWASNVGYVQAGLWCFEGLPATVSGATLTFVAIITGVTVLPTPGFLGSYEASAVVGLSSLGADPATAAAFGLSLHLAYTVFTVAVGLPALIALGASLSDLWDAT
ncbi:MAG TPA: flippase-like domain-containing protein [Deltaproteobacteria bacterium]|nr:flippase-like domain-containing protein [Deltaproteobacteria bacterium]